MGELHHLPVKSLVIAHERYLRRIACQPPRERLLAFNARVLWPWGLAMLVAFACLRASGQPLWMLLLLPVPLGLGWATWRFNKYGAEFDQTPTPAAWLDTPEGQRLLGALRRVASVPLSTLTPETRLREHLKFNDRDVFELFKMLPELDQTGAFPQLSQSNDVAISQLFVAIGGPEQTC